MERRSYYKTRKALVSSTTRYFEVVQYAVLLSIAIFTVYNNACDFKFCQPHNKNILCLDIQKISGWHINDNRWRNDEYRYINMLDFKIAF